MKLTPVSMKTSTLAALILAGALAACSKTDEGRSAGQELDATVAKVEQKVDEAKADAKAAGQEVKDAAGKAVDAVTDTAKDAGITALVNAAMAKDPGLSMVQINVDTVDGRVVLNGTAPDSSAKERATVLAAGVSGVGSVDNRLTVVEKK